jgi:hypothetical protein
MGEKGTKLPATIPGGSMTVATRIRTYGDVKQLPPGNYFAILVEYKRCDLCGGPHVATFEVARGGYSAGSSYLHEETCPSLRCEHGVLWNAPACKACDETDTIDPEYDE